MGVTIITNENGERCQSIQVGEHTFVTPPIPPKKDIIGWDKPQADQYWKRQMDFPDFFLKWAPDCQMNADKTKRRDDGSFESLSKKDTKELIFYQDRELIRRQEGVWFMNNGELTYLTGDHYFALQWCAFDGVKNHVETHSKYGSYMQFQRDFFYFFKIAETTPYGYGGYFIKPKKTGITQCMAAVCLNRATMMRNRNVKVMSTDEKNCKKVNFRYISYAIGHLPNILCPSIQTLNLGQVYFAPEEVAKSKSARSRQTNSDYLYSDISTIPTVYNAFDQSLNYIAWCDEFPKIDQPAATHNPTIASVKLGFDREGTIMYTSYVPENKSEDGKQVSQNAIKEAKTLYFDSKLSTIEANTSMTKSKLICHTLTVQEGNFGMVDKYGKPRVKEIWAELEENYNTSKHNLNQLVSYKKQNPTNEDEPWMEGGESKSIFNVIRLGLRMKEVEIQKAAGTLPIVTGELMWSTPPKYNERTREYDFKDASVWFRKDVDKELMQGKPRGNFHFYRHEEMPTETLNSFSTDRYNRLRKPSIDTPFFMSLDPTNYGLKKMISAGSQNAMMCFMLPSAKLDAMFGKRVSNRLCMQYLCRRDKPDDTVWDIVKAILYFGCYILIEGNMPGMATRIIELGLGNYILVRNKAGGFEPYREYNKQKYYVTSNNGDKSTIDEYIQSTKNYIGEPDNGEFDNLDNLYSLEIMSNLTQFEPENTRQYDAGVAFMIGVMGMDAYIGWQISEKKKRRTEVDGFAAMALRAAIN